MFRDRVRLKFKAGKGGDGKVCFGPHHLPTGGIGGDGGNIYLVGDNNLYDLSLIKPDFLYPAEDGKMGDVKNQTGRNGADFTLKVPLTTKVYDEHKNLMLVVDTHGEPKKLLSGGQGGLGNWFFRAGRARTAEKFTFGKPGEEAKVTLVLELQSDVIFIGLPNAGKSSVINELTNAASKVAAYEFTTLNPHLGQMGELKLMDLPGLIERTSEGRGLGTNFVKHTKSAKLLAHFVSMESADPVADYKLIRKELAEIDPDLAAKPEVIILTKSDLIKPEEVAAKLKLFKKFKKPLKAISVYDLDALQSLKQFFVDNINNTRI